MAAVKTNKKGILLVAIYSHPEYYPPTLNALGLLADAFEHIYIVHRNITGFDWQYPANVSLVEPGPLFPVREVEKAGTLQKIGWFLRFSFCLFRLLRKTRPDTLLMYDTLPTLSYRLLGWAAPRPRLLWYHNHDVSEARYIRPFSLSGWAWKSEHWIFSRLDLFSLPALERLDCFPMDKLKGERVFLPNYPSRQVYDSFKVAPKAPDRLVLLYQGSIGPLHGLEELIPLLSETFGGRKPELRLKGFISPEYLQSLQDVAARTGNGEKLTYIGPTGYREVVENAFTCHVGIGIHQKDDIMNRTLGTASNKIYEYAAAGLPVLLYDNSHFREKLGQYPWVFFTDCSAGSLRACLQAIARDYDRLSRQARADFESELCFEQYFLPLKRQHFSDTEEVKA